MVWYGRLSTLALGICVLPPSCPTPATLAPCHGRFRSAALTSSTCFSFLHLSLHPLRSLPPFYLSPLVSCSSAAAFRRSLSHLNLPFLPYVLTRPAATQDGFLRLSPPDNLLTPIRLSVRPLLFAFVVRISALRFPSTLLTLLPFALLSGLPSLPIMSQGAFFTFGFFALGVGTRRAVQKPVSPSKTPSSSSSTWYIFYPTTIQCPNDPVGLGLSAEVRIYSPPGDIPHPENTIAFIVAKACFPNSGPVLLDAISIHPIPGDPLSPDYEDRAPDMLYPYVYGLGTTYAKAETLADGKSKGFSVRLTERVRDRQETSTIQYALPSFSALLSLTSIFSPLCSCVLDGRSPRWVNVPPPSPNSLVSFLGVCSAIRPDRMLSVALEMLVYNPSAAPPSAPVLPTLQTTSSPTPSTKRRKFIAVHPVASPVAGPSTYAFFDYRLLQLY